MAIIVESGTGIANANSYIELADARAFLADLGLSLPVDDATAEAQLVRAAYYLNSFDEDIVGVRSSPLQPLLWPRSGDLALTSTVDLPGNAIPSALSAAQCFAAVAETDGELISSTASTDGGRIITKEKVGPIETNYIAASTGSSVSEHDAKKVGQVELALAPIKRKASRSGGIPTTVCRA